MLIFFVLCIYKVKDTLYSSLKLQKTTCHLQQHFFNIFESNIISQVHDYFRILINARWHIR
jgi:hypothetical protein